MKSTGTCSALDRPIKRQDNDLILVKDVQAAAKFKNVFEGRLASGELLSLV
jgi:hypothetical protein